MPIFLIDWSFIYTNPDNNGLTILICGFLLTLALYHFLLFFQHHNRAYLYYSLYTLLIFLYLFHRADHFILAEKIKPYRPTLDFLAVPIQWIFHTLYLFFTKTFIRLREVKPKWNRWLNHIILSYSTILLFLIIYADATKNLQVLDNWYLYFFLPTISIIAIIMLYIVMSLQTILKYYVFLGSVFYISFSWISLIFELGGHRATTVFYLGIFLENIFFALGLGALQKKALVDKNLAQQEVIKEHEINLKLQNRIKTQLDHEVEQKTKEIIELTKKHEQEKRHKLAVEYTKNTLHLRMRALQTQMNPHFLFNSLNSVKHFIIKNNPEEAVYFLSKLSKLIRKILDNSQKQFTSLAEELEVMKLYLDVENIRLNKGILYEQEIAPRIDLVTTKIPPLVLQPFIENAIWHGLSLRKGEKKIKLKIEKTADHLIICIKDNGIGREKAAELKARKIIEKESLGIELTKQRLDSFTEYLNGQVSIRFEDLKDGLIALGTKVIIQIPIR